MAHLRNLGQIAAVLRNTSISSHEAHADLAAFHAPGECGVLVERANKRHCVTVVEEIEAATGYTVEELIVEFQSRVGGKFLYMNGIMEPLEITVQHREDSAASRRRVAYHG